MAKQDDLGADPVAWARTHTPRVLVQNIGTSATKSALALGMCLAHASSWIVTTDLDMANFIVSCNLNFIFEFELAYQLRILTNLG